MTEKSNWKTPASTDLSAENPVADAVGVGAAPAAGNISWRERFGGAVQTVENTSLTRFAWLSIAAAVLTIAIKTGAWWITGSVGLLSDAIESLVNLAAAILALIALTIAAQPPDDDHEYGHNKAEYFSSGIEGSLILLAALVIAGTSIPRLLSPQPLDQVGIGALVSGLASLINLGVAIVLRRAGKRHRSITLEADAQHLLTDVWTSAGVIIAVVLVSLTGWYILDPVIALLVAANIIWTGVKLVQRSAAGLMDSAMDENDLKKIDAILDGYRAQGIAFHALRTRMAGTRSFVTVHVLTPGGWSVKRAHDLAEEIEAKLRYAVPGVNVLTHLEPLNDPAALADQNLDRD